LGGLEARYLFVASVMRHGFPPTPFTSVTRGRRLAVRSTRRGAVSEGHPPGVDVACQPVPVEANWGKHGGSSAPRSDARSVPCSPLPWQYCSSLFISLLLLSRPRVSGFSSAGWANSSWTSPDSATDLLVSYASDPGTSRDSRGCFFLLSVPVKISLDLRWRLVWPRFLYSLVFHRFPWV
jgi:hypothetical protein